ncbi:MAG TPA: hypothetical protein VJT73_13625 [Polyangiaceae bacterium]|nr:hypothetical protein [Polyangiaceae bacterium]
MPNPIGVRERDDACYGYDDSPRGEKLTSSTDPALAACFGPATPEVEKAATPSKTPPEGCAVTPDYYTLSFGASVGIGSAVSGTIDRYGHIYVAGGGGLESPGIGGSLMGGYLRDPEHPCEAPSEETLRTFFNGPSRTVVEILGVGVGTTASSGMESIEIGIGSPQVAYVKQVGAEVHRGASEAGEQR